MPADCVGQLGILEGYVSDTSSAHQDRSGSDSIARTQLIQTLTALHVWWLVGLSMKTSDEAVSKTSFELLGRPHIMGVGSKSEHHKKTRQKLNPLL